MTDLKPSQLAHLDTQRMTNYRNNLDFYNGTQWQGQGRERRLVFNYAKVSVDKVTSFLMQGLNFPCYPKTSPLSLRGAERQSNPKDSEAKTAEAKDQVHRAEQLLREVYEQNNLQQLDWETEIDTAVLGDGCYKVFWDAKEKRIRVTSPDVSGIYVWWLGDDLAKVWRVASQYKLTRDEIDLLYPHYASRITKKSATITESWTQKTFDLFLDDDPIESKPNPYGFIPFLVFPNLREPKQFWGTSDIPPLVQPQRELNRALSQLSRILELSGNPIAVLENIGSAEDIKVQPGAVWTIPEDAKAYLLDLLQGGGIRLHIDYIDLIYRTLHDISETPRAAYGGVEKELSGTALNIELGSLVQKIARKRTIRTNAYHRRTEMILRLAEKYLKADFSGITHRVVWGPILPADVARQAQNEQLLVQSGIHSRRTAMDEMGVQDPDREFELWLEERAAIRKQNVELPLPSTRGGPITRTYESPADEDD